MSKMDIINNEKELKDEAKLLIQQEEQIIAERIRVEQEEEAERLAQEEHEKVMEYYRKKRRLSIFCYGLLNFIIVTLLFFILVEGSMALSQNR